MPSFAYHAQALGFAATLTRPYNAVVPSQASVALSQSGGEGSVLVSAFNWNNLFTFDEARSYVTGSRSPGDNGNYNTLATTVISNLNILNMLHADLVVARITSTHVPGEPEGRITFTGSMFRNLTVGGVPIGFQLDDRPFSNMSTYDDFSNNGGTDLPNVWYDARQQLATASLISEIDCPIGNVDGFSINIPDFGTIYLGQVIIKPGFRRLSMIRMELGSPYAGTVTSGGGEGNGTEMLP